MGYTTVFYGRFNLNKKLDKDLHEYLYKFANTRRMARDLPSEYGVEGEFYVDGSGGWGQAKESNIIDYNTPPYTQPGLWCKWKPSEDGMGIEWNGVEKFYHYTEWLEYIVKNFLNPKGYMLNGSVVWQGEMFSDKGILIVRNNVVWTEDILYTPDNFNNESRY